WPERTDCMASGWPMVTVNSSSLSYFSKPHSFAAAICSAMAWPEIFTVGTAMRSADVKSAMVFTAGFRVVSTYGIDCTAQTARTSDGVPDVLSHRVASEGEATLTN